MTVAIIGYASIDHAVRTAEAAILDRTVRITSRPPGGWRRSGGSPAYVGPALAAEGIASPRAVSWVGDDSAGNDYRSGLQADGVDTTGIVAISGAQTPLSILLYAESGGCACLYDPGMPEQGLNAAQIKLVSEVDWLVVTVGPARALDEALDHAPPAARVAWLVKADPAAFTPALQRRLADRASLITHSAAERPFIQDALSVSDAQPNRLIVETSGAEGLVWRRERTNGNPSAGQRLVSAHSVQDQSGAGDTFAGGLLAGLIEGQAVEQAIDRGVGAADRLLTARAADEQATVRQESTMS